MEKIAILYWSGTGNTALMADAIAKGVREAGAEPVVVNISEDASIALESYEHIALGCPSMGDEVLEETEFEPFYESVKAKLSGKKVALFGSYGWGDGEWMRVWEEDVEHIGAKLFETGLMINGEPDNIGEANCSEFGKRFSAS
ncbi:flavodoxin [Fusibacter paucivorans]|uniref:Flavodoxin n=1 Tax=Fusibacter paucivorans TaxID=76009 RepID=A0ABS5PNY0_9FIRM|nr:flavodoxin [Fusibacter paucivorans]MBS7526291.1 flavodoxin [Fusibacter paucivorans]